MATDVKASDVKPFDTNNTKSDAGTPLPSGRILMKDGTPITPEPPKPEIVGQAGQATIKSDTQRLTLETPKPDPDPQKLDDPKGYVLVEHHPGALRALQYRGVCRKCGFQSHQPSEESAKQIIESHAMKHVMGR